MVGNQLFVYFQDLRNDPYTINYLKLYHQEPVKTEDGKFMAKQINAVAYLGGFHLHLFVFPFVYQFYTRMTAWVESTFLNPAELLFFLSFQNIMIWCVTLNVKDLLPLSHLRNSEMTTMAIRVVEFSNGGYKTRKFFA